jgi:hypothetical protein
MIKKRIIWPLVAIATNWIEHETQSGLKAHKRSYFIDPVENGSSSISDV